MLIDKEYIISRIVTLLNRTQVTPVRKNSSNLYRIKLLFPFWMRKFIFSLRLTLFIFYIRKKIQII
jgi:hypothetical protein